jgi:glyoxylate reductase
MALYLGLARGVAAGSRAVRDGDWAMPQVRIERLQGRRFALVGLGGIGRRVAQRARAFGFQIAAYDPYVDAAGVPGIELFDSVEQAVADADVVSVHAPLTPQTRHVIGERAIAAMQRAPIVVNTARGGLVDLDAATRALEDGRLGGLALDVTDPEPLPPDDPLLQAPNLLVVPHIGSATHTARERMADMAVDNLLAGLAGEPMPYPAT